MVSASLSLRQHRARYVQCAQRDLPRLDTCLDAMGHLDLVLLGFFCTYDHCFSYCGFMAQG